jgi:predicted NUDIX family NTP pyrophosphohydrolase
VPPARAGFERRGGVETGNRTVNSLPRPGPSLSALTVPPCSTVSVRTSAGILLYRIARDGRLEVLLAHPGGPFFTDRDHGDWTIPKGEPDGADEPLDVVARREFAEETGTPIDPMLPTIALGSIVQKGGKVVHAWAVEGDLDESAAMSNTFEMEWPPRSGWRQAFPEIDRVAWFEPDEARQRVKASQIPLIDRLEAALDEEAEA